MNSEKQMTVLVKISVYYKECLIEVSEKKMQSWGDIKAQRIEEIDGFIRVVVDFLLM